MHAYSAFAGIQQSVIFLYTELVFSWDQWKYSIFQSSTDFTALLCTMCAVPVFGYLFNVSDPTMGILSSLSAISSAIIMGIATSTEIFYVGKNGTWNYVTFIALLVV